MKRFLAAVCATLVFPVFAEVAPVSYYDDENVEELDADAADTADAAVQIPAAGAAVKPAPIVPQHPNASRAAQSPRTSRGQQSGGGIVPQRSISTRAASQSSVRNVSDPRAISSRTTQTQSRAGAVSRVPSRGQSAVSGVSARGGVSGTDQNRAISARAGSLYTPASTQARVGVSTSMTAGSRASGIGVRSTSTQVPSLFNQTSSTTSTSSTDNAEEIAAKTDFCKAQYASCLDNFCNVLDDNQGRCSCSKRIENFNDAENQLKEATIALQDVATKIKYLGLTTDEVKTLFTQTEAEAAMRNAKDTSALKNDLDRLQKILIDPKNSENSSLGLSNWSSSDLFGNFDFGNDFNFSSFLNGGNTDVKGLRGDKLFTEAQGRCESILTECENGTPKVARTLVTAYYDLEIDKQCIAYERSLIDSNDQMKQTIRNAQTILQQARLMVAQNKNRYDMKSCVNALDQCMQDEFACGDGYRNCLDASGKYIVGGSIVVANGFSLADLDKVNSNSELEKFLIGRIGTIDRDGRAIGMCSSIMAQCQRYTFYPTGTTGSMRVDGSSVSIPKAGNYMGSEKTDDMYDNKVLDEYLRRTIAKINASRFEVLAEYTSNCRSDLLNCLMTNNSGNGWGATQALTPTAKSACRALASTCSNINGQNMSGDEFSNMVWADSSSSSAAITWVLSGGKFVAHATPLETYPTMLTSYPLPLMWTPTSTTNSTEWVVPPEITSLNSEVGNATGHKFELTWHLSNNCSDAAITEIKQAGIVYAKWTSMVYAQGVDAQGNPIMIPGMVQDTDSSGAPIFESDGTTPVMVPGEIQSTDMAWIPATVLCGSSNKVNGCQQYCKKQ